MKINTITFEELRDGTKRFLPKWKDIPKEFKNNKTRWNILYRIWKKIGVVNYNFTMKPGVSFSDAVKTIAAHMSYSKKDISNNHKECGIAYMMSLFFEDYEFVDRIGLKLGCRNERDLMGLKNRKYKENEENDELS